MNAAVADVRFISVPTEITPGTEFSVVYGFSCSNMAGQPLAIKVAVYDQHMLWVGGVDYAVIPAGELTGTRMIDVTLHGTPMAADTYTIRIFAVQQNNVPQDGSMPAETLDLEDRPVSVLGAVALQSACVTLMSTQSVWKFQAVAFPRVCSGSKGLAGECFGELSYAAAESACAANGARICSQAELDAGTSKNIGCGYNSYYSWTTDTCQGGHIITGAIDSPDLQPQCIGDAAADASTHQVRTRCCADDVGVIVSSPNTASPSPAPTDTTAACINTCLVASCTDATCERWADMMGFCDENSLYYFWMEQNCPKACGFCSDSVPPPAPTMYPTDAVTQCETRTADVKQECTATQCCSGETMVCTAKKNRGRQWCLVEHPASSSKYYDGEPCFKHNQCDSRYCDRGGHYGVRYRCATPRTKSQASSQEEDEARLKEDDTILTVLIVIVGMFIIIGAVVVVVKYTRPQGNYNFMSGPASSSYQTSNSITTLNSDTKSAIRHHMPKGLKKEWERQSQAETLTSALTISSRGPPTTIVGAPNLSGVARVIADVKKVHNMARQPKPGVAAYMDAASQYRDESSSDNTDSRASTASARDMTGNHQQLTAAARALSPPPTTPANGGHRAVYI